MRYAVCFLLVLGGCRATPDTRLSVRVDSDLVAPGEIDRVEILVDSTGIGGELQSASVDLRPENGAALPARLGLSHTPGRPFGPLLITARGLLGDSEIVVARTDAWFVENEAREVRLLLARACGGVSCVEPERCVVGACVRPEPDAGLGDAGSIDAGSVDAGTCPAGFADCNGEPGDGCEADLTDVAHCGSCENRCASNGRANTEPTCEAGACGPHVCRTDFADCDGVELTGCEVDLRDDATNCGACARSCLSIVGPNAVPACDVGECVIDDCLDPFEDCDEIVSNGCECID